MLPSAHVDTFTRDHLPPPSTWPEFRFDRPEFVYPERLNCADALVAEQIAQGRGDRPAVGMLVNGRPVYASYAALLAQASRIAHVLVDDMKLVPGNRVLLRGPNHPSFAAAFLGIMKAGLVAVPTMPLLRASELKKIVDKAEVGAALCDVRLADELAALGDPESPHYAPALKQTVTFNDARGLEARAATKPAQFRSVATSRDDVCLLAFTSGTTGVPKGTMHFHRDVLAMCDAFSRHVLRPGPDDIFCGTPPIAFTFGLGGLLCFPLHAGARVILAERLTPESLLDLIDTAGATITFTAPTFYRQMGLALRQSRNRWRLSSLHKSVSAGEALPDATRTLWRETTGVEMIDGIGGTEVMHIYISAAGADVRPGAVGRVVPGYEACIMGPEGERLPPGNVGRLALKGPTGCRYLADARQTEYVQNGWNFPGDAFYQDADGYFYYQARTDDMIVSAGYNIAGPEVEAALLTHPAVAECGVVGLLDPERGQTVHAFVVLKEGHAGTPALTAALQAHVKAAIAPYKYPRGITYVATLPRTETGKLQRYKLRHSTA